MHNTIAAIFNWRTLAENKLFPQFCTVSKTKVPRLLLNLEYALSMFLNFGRFSASRSYKKALMKLECTAYCYEGLVF